MESKPLVFFLRKNTCNYLAVLKNIVLKRLKRVKKHAYLKNVYVGHCEFFLLRKISSKIALIYSHPNVRFLKCLFESFSF